MALEQPFSEERNAMMETTNRLPMHCNDKDMKQPESVVMNRPAAASQSNNNNTNGSSSSNQPQQSSSSSSSSSPQRVAASPQRGDGVTKHAFSKKQVERAMAAPVDDSDADNDTAMNVGIMASGLAWVQNQRERRRRQYLQNQAQQQLRKIAHAERPKRQISGLNENSTFQQLANVAVGNNNVAGNNGNGNNGCDGDLSNNGSENSFRVGMPKLSKSGEGASGHIDISELENEEDLYLTPKVRIEEETADGNDDRTAYILTPEQMHQIAIHVLPKTVAFCRWRRLYNLGRDGDSFSSCLRIISNVQPTLMVIRTTRGAVFGGYADTPWHSKEQGNSRFYGSAQACLFSVQPGTNKLNVYNWTGKNRYIQLCDVTHKMLAFGGGGDDGSFGLCVEEDFQQGSTGPCDTFDNKPLCDQENFEIVDLEFWEFLTGVF